MQTNEKPSLPLSLFHSLGENTLDLLNTTGATFLFFLAAFRDIFRRKQLRNIFRQIYFIGARSTTIVILIALFAGMVLGLQLYYTLIKFGSAGVLGSAVSLTLVRELGPVLTAIMVTARAGSAMTTEIGIQRISEQIDALYTMGVNPLGYLISPRLAASIISFPLLTTLFDLVGIAGGYLTGVLLLGLDSGTYFYRVRTSTELSDITGGYIKAILFAMIVSTICCYHGYYTHKRKDSYGAKAVGMSTTVAVVTACVLILIADYLTTSFLL